MTEIRNVIEEMREALLSLNRRVTRMESQLQLWGSHTHTVRFPHEPVGINDVALTFYEGDDHDVSRETGAE